MKAFTLAISVSAILSILPSQRALSLDVSPGSQTETSESSTALQQKEDTETSKIERNWLLAPIKNNDDLIKYLAAHLIEETPLGVLPERKRDIFLGSLVFTKKGLASFNSSVLVYGPTATEVYNILALFGLQSSIRSFTDLTIATEEDSALMGYH